jgi:hypothetical protein
MFKLNLLSYEIKVRLATKQNGTTQNYYTGAVVYKSDKTPDYILTSSGMIGIANIFWTKG